MAQHGLRGPQGDDRSHPWRGHHRSGQDGHAEGMGGQRPRQAQARQRRAHERGLDEEGQQAARGVERREESDQGLSVRETGDGGGVEGIVQEGLDERAERDETRI